MNNDNKNKKEKDFKIKMNHLNEYLKSKIDSMITKHKTVFAKDKYDVGTVNGYEARIDLLAEKYCSKRSYKCTVENKKEIEEQIAKLLDNKLITVHSKSP